MTGNMRGASPADRNRTGGAALVLAGVLGVMVLMGANAGITMGLWQDEESFTGQISTGAVGFAVGRVDDAGTRVAATDPEDHLGIMIGSTEANALDQHGSVVVPIQVEVLAQGSVDLSYEIHPPEFKENTILGAATVDVSRVEEPDACDSESVPPSPEHDLESTPVTPDDTATEFWCLVAVLDDVPIVGEYSSTGTVSAEWTGGEVRASDDWRAQIMPDPDAEPDATIGFTHETSRAPRR